MRATQLARAITIAATAQIPLFAWSEPGMGKSSIFKATAKARGRKLIDQRCAQMDAVDSRGMPMVNGGITSWATPAWLPKEPGTDIFLDELVQAPPLVMNSLSELILDGTMGGEDNYRKPDDTAIFAAGNRRSDRSATFEMPSQLRNRFVHVDLESDLDEWVKWAMDPDALPDVGIPKVETTSNHIHEAVIAFHRFRPNLLQKFDATQRASPTARSVNFVSKLLPYLLKADDLMHEMVAGCCGDGYATEFTGFLRLITRMPDPDLVFRNPEHAPIPEEPGIMYALCVALANRVVAKKTADPMFKYLGRISQDFAVVCAKDAIAKDVKILQCREGIIWATKNAPFLV